ncbi:hypothetical protein [Flavobacterium orientale]|nr:hypothetical protein [Flavobacterium orientale]
MKKFFILIILAFGSNNIQAQKTISLEAEGNLESPNPCECVELSKITNEHNPADILIGMGKCIEQKEFEKAAKLFAIAGVYGRYDSYRVKDKSAHQALLVLQQNILMNISEEDKKEMISSLDNLFVRGSEALRTVCQSIQEVGIPKYYPKYMIQHGIQAFIEKDGNGLIEDFNSEESWNLTLKNYLHCGE